MAAAAVRPPSAGGISTPLLAGRAEGKGDKGGPGALGLLPGVRRPLQPAASLGAHRSRGPTGKGEHEEGGRGTAAWKEPLWVYPEGQTWPASLAGPVLCHGPHVSVPQSNSHRFLLGLL